MKKTIGRFAVLILVGTWALFAINSGHAHTHKCNEEWKTWSHSYSHKPLFPGHKS